MKIKTWSLHPPYEREFNFFQNSGSYPVKKLISAEKSRLKVIILNMVYSVSSTNLIGLSVNNTSCLKIGVCCYCICTTVYTLNPNQLSYGFFCFLFIDEPFFPCRPTIKKCKKSWEWGCSQILPLHCIFSTGLLHSTRLRWEVTNTKPLIVCTRIIDRLAVPSIVVPMQRHRRTKSQQTLYKEMHVWTKCLPSVVKHTNYSILQTCLD